MLWIKFISLFCEIALRCMSQNTFDDRSTLVLVMAWCRQATSHYLNQCWPRSLFTCGYSELTRSCWCSPLVLFTRKYRLHFLDVLNLVLWYTRQIMNKDNHTAPHLDIAKQRDISTLQSLVQGSFVYALSQLEMALQCNVTQKMMLAAVYNLSGIFLWQTYSARMGISHCQRQVKMISVMKFSLIITYCKIRWNGSAL